MSVYLDGATLSALLFSHLNSSGSQYGFLIGEKIEHIEDRISDSQILTYDVNSYIYVSSFVPWPSRENIYSRGGHFRDEWIKQFFAKTEQQNVVGWYSFRHNTSIRPSLREITLHNNLSASRNFGTDFLFFLCTSSFSSNMSTHTCTHGFMHTIDGRFVCVPMAVMNLGDTTRKEYKKRSNTALSHSKTVLESLHTFRKGFLKSTGEVEQIAKMNHLATSINKSLMSIHNKVFESEAALGLLETDVDILRQRLEQLEQDEARSLQIEAERIQNERDDERRKLNDEAQAEEHQQLEKLFIDLGISSSDNTNSASSLVPGFYKTASFPVEDDNLNDLSIVNFQVIDPAPSLSTETAFGNSSDRKENCATGNGVSEQRRVTRSKINTREMKRPQNIKDKVSEAFSFLDEELKLKKVPAPQQQVASHSNIGKTTGATWMHDGACNKQLLSSTQETTKNKEQFILSDNVSDRTKVVESSSLNKDMTDCVNGSSIDDVIKVESHFYQ